MTYDRSDIHDRELVAGALAGDPHAIDTFVERMRCIPRFLSIRNRRSIVPLDKDSLEDLSQEVFAAVWRRLPEYRSEAALSTWVWQFCCRLFAGASRRAATGASELDIESHIPWMPRPANEQHDHEALHLALADLTLDERTVVVAKHFSDLTFREVADRVGVSDNTIKTRYYRALGRLRGWLDSAEEHGDTTL